MILSVHLIRLLTRSAATVTGVAGGGGGLVYVRGGVVPSCGICGGGNGVVVGGVKLLVVVMMVVAVLVVILWSYPLSVSCFPVVWVSGVPYPKISRLSSNFIRGG